MSLRRSTAFDGSFKAASTYGKEDGLDEKVDSAMAIFGRGGVSQAAACRMAKLDNRMALFRAVEALKEADETALPMQKMVGKSHEELIKLFEELNAEDTSDPKNKWKKTLQIIEKPGEGIGC